MADLRVFQGETVVADIEVGETGLTLRYDPAWRARRGAFPVSLSMPLAQSEHGPEHLAPWLMNLLPEGEPLRTMGRLLGVALDDLLALLSATGGDLAGALSLGTPRPQDARDVHPIPTDGALERIIEELPARPFLVGEDGVSMSLAGAQDKLPLARIDGRLAVPVNGAASTVILKPDNPRLPGSVQNEALCMVLARRVGLGAAEVTTGVAGRRSYLLVDRYDREAFDGGVRRLHQEDFCQALGRPPAAKYEHNQAGVRGPSLAEMFGLVREHMTARDTTRLLDAVIFNIAIGNVDSHAKNYAILLGPGLPRLAPLYDLMSGLSWPAITQNHAQDIGDQRRGRHIHGRHWRRFALAAGLAGPATVRRVARLTGRILAELPAAAAEVAQMPAGAHMLGQFQTAIAERVALVRDHAATDGPPQDGDDGEEAADGERRYDA